MGTMEKLVAAPLLLCSSLRRFLLKKKKKRILLFAGIDELPENVDPGKREEFLTDAEFLEVPLPSSQSYFLCQTNL